MDHTTRIVLIALIIGVPLFTYWLANRQTLKSRAKLAEQAGEEKREREVVSMMLIQSNKEVATVARDTALKTSKVLSEIYAKVDGSLTKAQEHELASARANLASMREVVSMKQDRGVPVLDETKSAMAALELQIEVLAAELKVKHEALADDETLSGTADAKLST